MRISDGKYISFIDSDDTWEKNKLEKQIYFMEKNNLTFSFTDYIPFLENNGTPIRGPQTNFKVKMQLKYK